jgi:hypothetical protein
MDKAITLVKEIYGGVNGQFIVHDINQGQHSEGSKHYSGEAIDGHFRGLNLFQTAMILFKAHFSGIGIYPDWKHKGVHADIRDQDHVSTWVQRNGNYIYDWNYFVEQLELEIECPEAA